MRPLKFKNNIEFTDQIEKYFENCNKNNKPYTISGLAVALDTNRQTLLNYEKKGEFFDTIKKAKAKIEAWTEEQLFSGKAVAGVIFNLKNNYRWVDKIENTNTHEPLVVKVMDYSE